jgi:rubredoxin
VFSSILIRKRYLINFFGLKLFSVYDILCAKDFNPNERTGEVFSTDNPRIFLPEQLRRSVVEFYNYKANINKITTVDNKQKKETGEKKKEEYFYQCVNCFTVYDDNTGEPETGIAAGTLFENLPETYCCPLCEAEKDTFKKIQKSVLGSQTV